MLARDPRPRNRCATRANRAPGETSTPRHTGRHGLVSHTNPRGPLVADRNLSGQPPRAHGPSRLTGGETMTHGQGRPDRRQPWVTRVYPTAPPPSRQRAASSSSSPTRCTSTNPTNTAGSHASSPRISHRALAPTQTWNCLGARSSPARALPLDGVDEGLNLHQVRQRIVRAGRQLQGEYQAAFEYAEVFRQVITRERLHSARKLRRHTLQRRSNTCPLDVRRRPAVDHRYDLLDLRPSQPAPQLCQVVLHIVLDCHLRPPSDLREPAARPRHMSTAPQDGSIAAQGVGEAPFGPSPRPEWHSVRRSVHCNQNSR